MRTMTTVTPLVIIYNIEPTFPNSRTRSITIVRWTIHVATGKKSDVYNRICLSSFWMFLCFFYFCCYFVTHGEAISQGYWWRTSRICFQVIETCLWFSVVGSMSHRSDPKGGRSIWHSLPARTAQGGGRSFKDRKPIGEVGCCDAWMAEQSHWWIDWWLQRRPIYLSIYLPVITPDSLTNYLTNYLTNSLTIWHMN